jgi:hypothetical protein
MKKLTMLFSLLAIASLAHAQDDAIMTGQPVADWIQMAHNAQASRRIMANDILYPQDPQKFPPNMMDTLVKYDWVNVANYWYKDNTFLGNRINELSHQTFFMRYFEDGSTQAYFALEKFYETPAEMHFSGGSSGAPVTVGEKLGFTWLFYDFEKNDALRLVSYQNGLLIIDCTEGSEKFGDIHYYRRFRDAYIKVPKRFVNELGKMD